MRKTPYGLRLHIALFGRRNVGKSSILNAMTRQNVSIVSNVAGTTTDPVEKPMELLPIGPVLFIDTGGIDDLGDLGQQRVDKSRKVFERADVGLIVGMGDEWGTFETELLSELKEREIPTIVVFNKVDLVRPNETLCRELSQKQIPCVYTVATNREGILDLREALIKAAPTEIINTPSILGDILPAGELAILVVPIDLEAPKGRLILPQVQTIRDILDNDAYCLMVKDRELPQALNRLKAPPALVITDSQAFKQVAAAVPKEVPLTSFSILFARFKGDLSEMVRGALAVEKLKSGDRVLIAESCTHHPIGDDIGRVKIPRWLNNRVGGELDFTVVQGRDWPTDLSPFKLVIHCGACVWNRRQMLSRIIECRKAGVPITNYGVVISYTLGLFHRALAPFPSAKAIYQKLETNGKE